VKQLQHPRDSLSWQFRIFLAASFVLTILIFAFLGATKYFGPFYRRDLRIHVKNVGQVDLVDITIHVTGNNYEIGKVATSESKTVPVVPTGQSHLEISLLNKSGGSKHSLRRPGQGSSENLD
jgi:hypothetical protein